MHILIASQKALDRDSLKLLLRSRSAQDEIALAANHDEIKKQIQARIPDVIILRGDLPDASIPEIITPIHNLDTPPVTIVLDGRLETEQIVLEAGAHAFISTYDPPKKLMLAVETARLQNGSE